jgi:hypothetical protein
MPRVVGKCFCLILTKEKDQVLGMIYIQTKKNTMKFRLGHFNRETIKILCRCVFARSVQISCEHTNGTKSLNLNVNKLFSGGWQDGKIVKFNDAQ